MANAQRTAIVTGASQGIGAGLVDAFLKRRYSVVANSRNITKANPFPVSGNLAFFQHSLKGTDTVPHTVVTDRLRSYSAAFPVYFPEPNTNAGTS